MIMENSNNYISSQLTIKKGQDKSQRIINSFENFKRKHLYDWDWDNILAEKNEEQIKLSKIYIDSRQVNFSYFHTFQEYGNYEIRYYFNEGINSINFLFINCECITSVDFSHFKIDKMKSISN